MVLFERYVSPHELLVFAFENLLIGASIVVPLLVLEPVEPPGLVWKVLVAALLCQLCLYYNDFYDLALMRSGRELIVRLVQGAGAATIMLGLIWLAAPSLALHSDVFLKSLAALLITMLAWRLLFNRLLRTSPLVENTLVVGMGAAPRAVARELVANHGLSFRVVGYVADDPDPDTALEPVPVVGRVRDIRQLVARESIDRILVGLPDGRKRLPARELVDAKLSGVVVEDAVAAYERLTGKVLLDELKLSSMVFAERFNVSRGRQRVKRAWDLTFSIIGLILAAPLIAGTALLVWVSSGRPVLYRQERIGQHHRTFTLYKFRSMRLDAEAAGPTWARANDDRVTPVGRFIRLTRLDELPQLWNVLMGHMSFVGPRPERPCFVAELSAQIPFYGLRHAVKPGVTGWAQVRYRYADSVESAREKLCYDLYYVKHLSVAFDLTIVIDTVKTIVFRMGPH
jgi:sugar transferase (PEP-CTERM system associated)